MQPGFLDALMSKAFLVFEGALTGPEGIKSQETKIMSTDLNQLPAHVQQAMQETAAKFGVKPEFVDPAHFADLPEPVDNSYFGRTARQAAAYQTEAAANREAAELEELKATAAADLPGNEELAEMAQNYGVSAERLLAHFTERKAAAQTALGQRKAAIEATRQAAEQQAAEGRLQAAIASRNLSTIIDFGNDQSNPDLAAVARAAMAGIMPAWKWEK